VPPGLRHAADISFAGDGEPTAAPEFAAAARSVRAVRDREGLAAPLRLLTNATLLDRGAVRAALAEFDELWCKLDAGSDEYFHRVNGTRLPLARVLANLAAVARERPIVVQSLFPTFAGEGPPPQEVEAYVARLRELVEAGGTVQRVQVYTVARPPADPHVGALAPERLAEIAARVKALGLPVEVFGGEAETWPPSAGSHA
jgi:wyosine [tRNA(Phe)-imidazoG37] synthetase (radical SAM superfamily)